MRIKGKQSGGLLIDKVQVKKARRGGLSRGFLEEVVRKGEGQLHSIYGLALHHYQARGTP